jgi:hypothetical protein
MCGRELFSILVGELTEIGAMRAGVLVLTAVGMVFAIGMATAEEPKGGKRLWAAISPKSPVTGVGGTDPLLFNFALVNDGEQAVDPGIERSRLLVNGKEVEDLPFLGGEGPRDKRFLALPAGDYVRFTYALKKRYFPEPGVYEVSWKGKDFQAPEVLLRVLSGKAAPQEGRKLWAAIGFDAPVYVLGGGEQHLALTFALVNDGDQTVDPEIRAMQLLINGKELKDFSFSFSQGPFDKRSRALLTALPPGDVLSRTAGFEDHFKEPGVYKVSWKGKEFEAPEIVVRVLAAKGGKNH